MQFLKRIRSAARILLKGEQKKKSRSAIPAVTTLKIRSSTPNFQSEELEFTSHSR